MERRGISVKQKPSDVDTGIPLRENKKATEELQNDEMRVHVTNDKIAILKYSMRSTYRIPNRTSTAPCAITDATIPKKPRPVSFQEGTR